MLYSVSNSTFLIHSAPKTCQPDVNAMKAKLKTKQSVQKLWVWYPAHQINPQKYQIKYKCQCQAESFIHSI